MTTFGRVSGSALDETTQEAAVDKCDPPADGDAALSTENETNLDLSAKQKQQQQQQQHDWMLIPKYLYFEVLRK